MNPTLVAGQLDQPLPAPPDRSEPPPAPKLTKPPAVKKQVEPIYPPEAFAAGLAGDVTLTIDIDADGRVTAVAVNGRRAWLRRGRRGRGAGNGVLSGGGRRQAVADPDRIHDPFPAQDGRRRRRGARRRRQVGPDAGAAAAAPPVASAPARVVVRGQVRERGTREPLAGADVAVIRRGAALDGGDLPAEVTGTTDDDGRFEVRVSAPRRAARGRLRHAA